MIYEHVVAQAQNNTIFKTVQARILIKTGSHFAKHTGVEYVKAMKPATWKWIKFKDLGPTIIQVAVNSSPSRDLANKAINNHHDDE
jgi:hypothetical protein